MFWLGQKKIGKRFQKSEKTAFLTSQKKLETQFGSYVYYKSSHCLLMCVPNVASRKRKGLFELSEQDRAKRILARGLPRRGASSYEKIPRLMDSRNSPLSPFLQFSLLLLCTYYRYIIILPASLSPMGQDSLPQGPQFQPLMDFILFWTNPRGLFPGK